LKIIKTSHIDLKESGTSDTVFHCHCCNRTWNKRDQMARKFDFRLNMPYQIKEGVIDLDRVYAFSFWQYNSCIECLKMRIGFMINVLTCLDNHIRPEGVDWQKLPDALKSLPYKQKPQEVIPYD